MALDENELAFYTNEELIQELMKRQNFMGMVIYADSPESIINGQHVDFKLYGKGFSPQQTQALLSTMADQVGFGEEEYYEEDEDEEDEDWK